jgi:hypothetical protein
LISEPFHHGLVTVFTAAAVMAVISALASVFRGGVVRTETPDPSTETPDPTTGTPDPSTERTQA